MGGVGERSIRGGDGEGGLGEWAVIKGEDRKVLAVPLIAKGMSVLGCCQ